MTCTDCPPVGYPTARTAKHELIRQCPELKYLNPIDKDWKAFAEIAISKLGETIEIDGPHGSGTILAAIGL